MDRQEPQHNVAPLIAAMIASLGKLNVALNKAKASNMDRYRKIRSAVETIDRELGLWKNEA